MDTLSFHKQRPLLSCMDLTDASLVHVVGEYNNAKDMLKKYEGAVKASPEKEALWFYLQNHAMCLVGKAVDNEEPLGDYQKFVDTYHTDIQRKTIRMFYYLLLICTRESRHMKSGAGKEKIWKKYPNIKEFHSNYIQDTSETVVIDNMLKYVPDVSLGEYTDYLVDAFQLPSYDGGFGGKKWKEVARPLRDFVHGKISAEMMMDVAFTLAHNGGPIFNKGMLYNSFNKQTLLRILDIQRSGQIPQAIMHPVNIPVESQMVDYVRSFSKLSKDVTGKVDWKRVRDIKGNAKYHTEIQQQFDDENGLSLINKLKEKATVHKEAAANKATAEAAAEVKKNGVEIMPGVFVAKGKRSLS